MQLDNESKLKSAYLIARIRELAACGWTAAEIADALGVAESEIAAVVLEGMEDEQE